MSVHPNIFSKKNRLIQKTKRVERQKEGVLFVIPSFNLLRTLLPQNYSTFQPKNSPFSSEIFGLHSRQKSTLFVGL